MTWFITLMAFAGLAVLALFFPVVWIGVLGLVVLAALYALVRVVRPATGRAQDDRVGLDSGDEGRHPGRG